MRAPRPVLGDFLRNAPFSVLILLLILAVACSAVPPSISPVTQETLQVPASAPDTIPSDILDNLDPEYGVPPDVLAVAFKSGLTRERKAEILASVGGEAINRRRTSASVGWDLHRSGRHRRRHAGPPAGQGRSQRPGGGRRCGSSYSGLSQRPVSIGADLSTLRAPIS